MAAIRKKPVDLPTLLLVLVPLIFITWLTLGWARAGMTRKAFDDAALRGDVAALNRLLDQGADISAPGRYGRTALAIAANERRLKAVQLLLARGAQVNEKEGAGLSAMYWATKQPLSSQLSGQPVTGYNTEIIRLLLKHGGDPSQLPANALQQVIESGDIQAATLLIEHGADVNPEMNAANPLIAAVQNGHHGLIALIIAKGADVNQRQVASGDTPLQRAVEMGDAQVVQLLLAHGARTDVKDKFGNTPLKTAIRAKRPGLVRLLKAAGAKS
jgi:ankyrin repeat protein